MFSSRRWSPNRLASFCLEALELCEPAFLYLCFGDSHFGLVWSSCECVFHPEVTWYKITVNM